MNEQKNRNTHYEKGNKRMKNKVSKNNNKKEYNSEYSELEEEKSKTKPIFP